MTSAAIIPARFGSSRFPGKPLALLGGKPVVQWVYENAAKAVDNVLVATDDSKIIDAVHAFGGEAVLTSPSHLSGTSRVCEAYSASGLNADVVVNLQGDEPFVSPEQIRLLLSCFDSKDTDIATLVYHFDSHASSASIDDPNLVKVILDSRRRAVMFSRSVIPFVRDSAPRRRPVKYFCHVGIYAFRPHVLANLVSLPPSPIEEAEHLEQLTWLYHGYRIHTACTDSPTVGIDTPADLLHAERLLSSI